MESTAAETKTSAWTAGRARRQWGDRAFKWLTFAMALVVFVLIVLIGIELMQGSHLALRKFG